MNDTTGPELRHCREYLNALLWTCPDDHTVLRSTASPAFIPRPGVSPDGNYACTAGHEWKREDGTWMRSTGICPECGHTSEYHGDDIECAVR